MKHRFGKIENGEMVLNEYGKIARYEWIKLSERFPNFELDVFQIMPNHMHGIIVLNDKNDTAVRATLAVAPNTTPAPTVGAGLAPAQNNNGQPVVAGLTPAQNDNPQNTSKGQPPGLPLRDTRDDNGATARVAPTTTKPATVGDIIGAYKSLVTNACLEIWKLKWAGVNPAPYMGKLWQRNGKALLDTFKKQIIISKITTTTSSAMHNRM